MSPASCQPDRAFVRKMATPVRCIRPRSKLIKQQIELKLRDGEWRGEDFKAHDPLMEGAGQFKPEAAFIAFAFQFRCDAPGDLKEVRAGAAAGIKNDDIGIGEAARPAEFGFEKVVNTLDLVADDFRRRVPDAQIFPQLRVEGFEERLVEIRDGGDCRLAVDLSGRSCATGRAAGRPD